MNKRSSFVSAVIVAAGSGKRMGANKNKLLLLLRGKSILSYTLSAFENTDSIDEIVLVVSENDRECIEEIVKKENIGKLKCIALGGQTRQQSVYNGLLAVSRDAEIVAIHDGARCFITPDVITKTVNEALLHGAAAAGCRLHDTLKVSSKDGFITDTLNRDEVWRIQTPQTFQYNLILKAHKAAIADSFVGTDDCILAERHGIPIKIVDGGFDNIKITTQEDLLFAEGILASRGNNV